MSLNHARLRELFLAACDLPESQQDVIVDEHCADDPGLRRELKLLLRQDARKNGIFSDDKITEGIEFQFDTVVESELPKQIGRYRVKRVLGEGGMGVVYLAEQPSLSRDVAVKVIRSGMVSPDLLKRFELEAAVLGRLMHPGIASIYEASVFVDSSTGQERPFLAMEYIEGQPLRDYAEQLNPGLRDRLQLFVQICEAVHHAHQRGVIHRDLKPTNILVQGDGQPSILDFGVARATGMDPGMSTLQTRAGQLIGTLPYMSPEQVSGHSLDVDIRSDIYSLGVIAYELLTGKLPYDVEDVEYLKAAKAIAEDQPTPLSSIGGEFRGDLNTIVLKALEKQPEHRYQTALDLAADLQRFLRCEPILARRIGPIVRVWKWCQRNRAVSALLSLLALAIVLGFVGMTRQTLSALASKRLAEDSAHRTERVLDLLVRSFRSPDPTIDGRDVKMSDVLNHAATDFEGDLTDDPLLKAKLLNAIGESMQSLGVYDHGVRVHTSALKIRMRELGEEHPDTMTSMANLAALHFQAGNQAEALRLFIRSAALRTKILGEEHPDTLKSMNDLSVGYGAHGDWDAAIKLRRRTFQIMQRTLGPAHRDTIKAMMNVAHYHVIQGDYDQALPIAEEARRLSKLSLGERHPTTINSLHLLAVVFDAVRPAQEALPLHTEVVTRLRDVLGEEHPRTLAAMTVTAIAYLQSNNEAEAIRLFEAALPALQTTLGDNEGASLRCMTYLGYAYLLADQPQKALEVLKEADRLSTSRGVPEDQTFQGRRYLAEALLRTGHKEKGVDMLEHILQLERTHDANDALATADALAEIASAYLDGGMFAEAEHYLRESLVLLQANSVPEYWRQFAVQSALGAALAEQGNREEAEALLLSGGRGLLAERVESPYPSPRELTNAVTRIIRFYELTQQPDQARDWRLIAETKCDFRQ